MSSKSIKRSRLVKGFNKKRRCAATCAKYKVGSNFQVDAIPEIEFFSPEGSDLSKEKWDPTRVSEDLLNKYLDWSQFHNPEGYSFSEDFALEFLASFYYKVEEILEETDFYSELYKSYIEGKES